MGDRGRGPRHGLRAGFRATIAGRVGDPSGAAVPSVQVQVKNNGTNEVAIGVTDSQGNFTVPFLRPGTFAVTVEAQGLHISALRVTALS